MFESLGSCLSYIEGKTEITVYLPAKAPYCQYCEFLNCHQNYERYQCRLTGEYILNYKRERGELCPLKMKGE